jgi:hypothetical protein
MYTPRTRRPPIAFLSRRWPHARAGSTSPCAPPIPSAEARDGPGRLRVAAALRPGGDPQPHEKVDQGVASPRCRIRWQ